MASNMQGSFWNIQRCDNSNKCSQFTWATGAEISATVSESQSFINSFKKRKCWNKWNRNSIMKLKYHIGNTARICVTHPLVHLEIIINDFSWKKKIIAHPVVESGIFRDDYVNVVATDALDRCVVRWLTTILLNKCAHVIVTRRDRNYSHNFSVKKRLTTQGECYVT